jgi:hypothetical protein
MCRMCKLCGLCTHRNAPAHGFQGTVRRFQGVVILAPVMIQRVVVLYFIIQNRGKTSAGYVENT